MVSRTFAPEWIAELRARALQKAKLGSDASLRSDWLAWVQRQPGGFKVRPGDKHWPNALSCQPIPQNTFNHIIDWATACFQLDEHWVDSAEKQTAVEKVNVPSEPPTPPALNEIPLNEFAFSGTITEQNRLLFDKRRIPTIYGREKETEELREFLDHKDDFRWWILTGSGGSGKTRLAHEICIDYRSKGWHAGFASEIIDATGQRRVQTVPTAPYTWTTWQPSRPTLIVVDYVLSMFPQLWTHAISELTRRTKLKFPVRILLIDRPRDTSAYNSIFGGRECRDSLHKSPRGESLFLGPLPKPAVKEIFSYVLANPVLKGVAPRALPEETWEQIYSRFARLDPGGRALYATLAAERFGETGDLGKLELRALSDWVVDRFLRHWKAQGVGLDYVRLLVLATMTRGLKLKELDLSEAPPGVLPSDVVPETLRNLTSVGDEIDTSELFLRPFQPDPVGEALVLRILGSAKSFEGQGLREHSLAAQWLTTAGQRLNPEGFQEFGKLVAQDFLAEIGLLREVRELNLNGTQVSDLRPLGELRNLRRLELKSTQVSDLSPISELRILKWLMLSSTQVSDLSPLSELKSLEWLDLGDTLVSDLSPMSELRSLKWLKLNCTQVSDLSPLSELRSLEWLELGDTLVSDLSPMNELRSLLRLKLNHTQVSNLSPLSELRSLKSLKLNHTQVSDLSPLSGLRSLEELYFNDTQVSDLSPISELRSLKRLELSDTLVSDLSPLDELRSLKFLKLNSTQVSDLSPLSELTNLHWLHLNYTQVSDLSSLSQLKNLIWLHLDYTQVSDLSPLSQLWLSELSLNGTQVSDLSPISKLKLQRLELNSTQVSDLVPLSELTSLEWLDLTGTNLSDLSPLTALSSLRNIELTDTQVFNLSPASRQIWQRAQELNRKIFDEDGDWEDMFYLPEEEGGTVAHWVTPYPPIA